MGPCTKTRTWSGMRVIRTILPCKECLARETSRRCFAHTLRPSRQRACVDCGSCSGEASSSSALPVDTLYICTEFHLVWGVWEGINSRNTTRKTSKMRSGGGCPKHLRPVSRAKHALKGNIVRITRIPGPVLVLAHGATYGPAPKHGS